MFSFKKDFKVYMDFLDSSSLKRLSVTDSITFSKVFEEIQVPKKTLHAPTNYYSPGKITKSFQANFSYTVELTRSTTTESLVDFILNIKKHGLVIAAKDVYYKFVDCYITNCVFVLETDKTIKLEISGSASTFTIDKTAPPSVSQVDFLLNAVTKVSTVGITYNAVAVPSVTKVYLELATEMKWLENKTIHSTIGSDVTTTGPTTPVVTDRTFSGNFYSYHLGDTTYTDNFYDNAYANVPINITVTSLGSNILQFLMSSAICTSRVSPDDVVTRAFDFRLAYTPTLLSSVIIYSKV